MFTNPQIKIDDLPKADAIEYIKIEQSYFYIIICNLLLKYTSIIVVLTLLKTFSNKVSFIDYYWWLIGILATVLICQLLVYQLGFQKRKYAIRDKDIAYSEGLITNTRIILPFNRIQHIEIKRSFLSRRLNLATLKIYSAGESGGDLSINGLPKDVAEKINAYLTNILNERL